MHNLRGEIANDVGSVAAPESADALLLIHARGAVHDALRVYEPKKKKRNSSFASCLFVWFLAEILKRGCVYICTRVLCVYMCKHARMLFKQRKEGRMDDIV